MITDQRPGTLAQEQSAAPVTPGTVFGPASFAQRRLWLLDRLFGQNATYNLLLAYRIEGPLDLRALTRALNGVVERHEVLRTGLVLEGSEDLVQAIAAAVHVEIAVHDLQGSAPGERLDAAQQAVARDAALGFDLSRAPLLRAAVYRLDEAEYVLSICFHHTVFDGWSEGVFLNELASLYDAAVADVPAPLEGLPIQYADFAEWQREQIAGEYLAEGLAYWKQALAGAPAHLELPLDHARSRTSSSRGGYVRSSLPSSLVQRVSRLGREQRATLFMTLLAAFYVVLHRYARQNDIVIGTALAGRNRAELEPLIGYFVNTVAMRATLSDGQSFVELLRDVKTAAIKAQDHQDIPFERVVEVMHPERGAGTAPFSQVLFILQSATSAPPSFRGLQWSRLTIHNGTSKGDLMLSVSEDGDGLRCGLEYDADLFTCDSAQRLLESFQLALERAVVEPETAIDRWPLVPAADERLLDGVNETAAFYPESTVHDLVSAQASRTPDPIALLGHDATLTYGELDRRANRLARYLQARGAGPGTLLGICLERSPEMVVALLAVLKAGAAYVPLDPSYPVARLDFMVRDAGLRAIVTSAALGSIFGELDLPIVTLDGDREAIAAGPDTPLPASASPDDLAYLIYTSGSTGHPKGVQVSHRNLVNFLWAMRERPGVHAEDRLLAVTTISFDISCLELFLPLAVGARIVIATTEEARDGTALRRLLDGQEITVMQATPATWRLLLVAGWRARPAFKAVCGGEALTADLASALLAAGADLWNVYGPTETTVWSTLHHVVAVDGAPQIGRPIANTDVFVLDKRLQRVPIGVSGELYIGGAGVARGYRNRPELTANRFVADPAKPGRRLYRTGDLVRMRPDGTLDYLARADDQIKLRGFRIEPGEIEAALLEHPEVREAVVAVKDILGEQRLVAYVVPRRTPVPSTSAWRTYLKDRLPEYMVPSAFVVMEEFPLTPNGKVDRKRLPAPDSERPELEGTYVAPRTRTEEMLAALWGEVLAVGRVGIHDNFFDLGGHSLLAVLLFARLEQQFGQKLPPITLFKAGTISELAAILEGHMSVESRSPLVELQPNGSRPPIYFLHLLGGDVLYGRNFSRYLGAEQPVYGFRMVGGETESVASIEALATRYVNELRRLQPRSAYCLAGYCSASVIAYEMARQLCALGERVPLLVMIDPGPFRAPRKTPAGTLRRLQAFCSNLPHWLIDDALQMGPKALWDRVQGRLKKFERKIAGLVPGRNGSGSPRKPELTDIYGVAENVPDGNPVLMQKQLQMLMDYKPAPYPGRITLIRARAQDLFFFEEPHLGWGDLAADGVDVKIVPGNHATMMRDPSIHVVREYLRDALDRAQAS